MEKKIPSGAGTALGGDGVGDVWNNYVQGPATNMVNTTGGGRGIREGWCIGGGSIYVFQNGGYRISV